MRDEVQPAKVAELGELVFIQLTDRPETALTVEGEARRRKLAAVMAPIVPPPRPAEGRP